MDRHMLALLRQMDAGKGRVFLEKEAIHHILSSGLTGHCLRKKRKTKWQPLKLGDFLFFYWKIQVLYNTDVTYNAKVIYITGAFLSDDLHQD